MAPVYCHARLELAVDDPDDLFDTADPGSPGLPIFDPAIFGGGAWFDAAGALDLRDDPIVSEYGIRSNDPNERVATAGDLRFTLDNSEANSSAILGLYSMFNAARQAGFDFNIAVRLILWCDEVASGADYYKFYGGLAEAQAQPGATQDRRVYCLAHDIWDDYTRMDEPLLEPQVDQRADQLVTALLDALATQPLARDIETGSETYGFAFDGGTGQQLKVRERLIQIEKSEFGFAYSLGDGTLRSEARGHRSANPTIVFAFDNDMDLPDPVVPASREDIYSSVRVTFHPTNDVAAASVDVLFAVIPWANYVEPGMTQTLFGPYRDQATNTQVGGTEMVDPPVSGTDYAFNSQADGLGADLTADFTVVHTFTGAGASYTVTNNGSIRGYALLQARGKPVFRYDADMVQPTASTYGERVLEYDMPYQGNINTAAEVAAFLAAAHGVPNARPLSFRFNANRDTTHMQAALELEPGDRISVSEQVTGLDGTEFTVNGLRYELESGGMLWCTVFMEPANSQRFWSLGVAGSSELGVTTVLGF